MAFSPYTQKLIAGLVTAVSPVAVMVGMHIGWMEEPAARKRMAMKHAGFWSGMALGLYGFHQWILKQKGSFSRHLVFAVGLASLPILGYQAAKSLSRSWFPKTQPEPVKLSPNIPLELAPPPEFFPTPAPTAPEPPIAPAFPPVTSGSEYAAMSTPYFYPPYYGYNWGSYPAWNTYRPLQY